MVPVAGAKGGALMAVVYHGPVEVHISEESGRVTYRTREQPRAEIDRADAIAIALCVIARDVECAQLDLNQIAALLRGRF
jgi:predicted metal-binding protein